MKQFPITRKQVSESLDDMTPRQVQFYSEQGLLPDLEQSVGRGQARKYSLKDLIALAVINELANYGMTVGKLQAIMNTWYSVHREWWDKPSAKGFLVVYGGEGSQMAVDFLPTWSAKAVDWEGYQSAVVLNFSTLLSAIGINFPGKGNQV